MPRAPALAFPPPGSSPCVPVHRLRIALGTWVAIEAAAESASAAQAAVEAAFAAIAEVEARMHPSREGSDLARINSAAPGEITSIHASTTQVLRLALRLHALTGGVFDPCLPLKRGRLEDLEFDFAPGGALQVICRVPVALDFGGIAKGYAIDCAITALVAAGCRAALVNAGGDLRLFGACGQTILLRGPDSSYQPLELKNTALAVSDCDANCRPPEHRGYYLRTGAPQAWRRYAAVLARDAMTADALTKCALLCPEACAQDVLREFDARDAA